VFSDVWPAGCSTITLTERRVYARTRMPRGGRC
jgi:hypothetical protein